VVLTAIAADYPKAQLGRYLFYDKRLSVNGTQSCATCHRQELAFTDARAAAVGATGITHPRGAMSLVNVADSTVLTWSNPEVRSLESQALIPMLSETPVELGLHGREKATLDNLRRDPIYRDLFPKAFPDTRDPFTLPNVAQALAAFERTIVSARSPYDRYYYRGDRNAISEAAQRGEMLFFSDPVAGCFRCHSGPNFTDGKFHNTALYDVYPEPNRGVYEHTRNPADLGKFKTPTLRNIALTAPYMHDGSIRTLEEVLDHYAAGGRGHLNPNKDKRMNPIALTAQNRADLIAFLESLTDTELIRDPYFSDPW
jgi:cytochrome c peroxidase